MVIDSKKIWARSQILIPWGADFNADHLLVTIGRRKSLTGERKTDIITKRNGEYDIEKHEVTINYEE